MKILLRIAAALAFLFPFLCGVGLLGAALSSNTTEDFWLPTAIGAFLVGNGFFVGAMLLFAAEKVRTNDGTK